MNSNCKVLTTLSVELQSEERLWKFLFTGKARQKVEEGFTAEQLPELLKDEQAVIWIDMAEPTKADEDVLLDVFHFHPLTVEDCRENRHYPKVEEFPGYLYLIVHGVRADTSPDHFNTIELDAFLGHQLCDHLSPR